MTTNPVNKNTYLQDAVVDGVLRELMDIRAEMIAETLACQLRIDQVRGNNRDSARNLLHYLALRRRDLRPLQLKLAALGLSSLGRAESHVLATIDAVLEVLHRLTGQAWMPPAQESTVVDFAAGERLLADHSDCLLGAAANGRGVRIMVTMPSEAAEDYSLIHNLLEQGMDCMRINCAHDDSVAWAQMIAHLQQAERALSRTCRVVMDLAGPKLRTGPLDPRLAVLRIRPTHDDHGRLSAPARVWLTAESQQTAPHSPANASLLLPAEWLSRLFLGEQLKFTDARGAKRNLTVVDITEQGYWAEATQSAYIVPGTVFNHERKVAHADDRQATINLLPQAENAILLKQDDLLILTRDLAPGRPATYDSSGQLLTPAMIGCSIPEIFDDVRAGEPIWFDDGKIGGVIDRVEFAQVMVRITHVRPRGEKLRGDKGINLPESRLRMGALTPKDIEDLAFVVENADVIELSFANTAADVELLHEHMARLGDRRPAIVLKIETRRAFENLPTMLLAAMRAPCCGVMIARGDLAVECGFERLAEVQEEILWICEAAHVPVIWATQVLETLAKEGMPSRAEITDAAMGDRAECVMINKGPHVLSAVRVLDDILRRMQQHQAKKRAMLRELRLAHTLTIQQPVIDECTLTDIII
ncbi:MULTISPECIES: pyruvate kinase [Methylomonas]|uniref:pyruvate kinase n=2 Tax=Methylomonas TaxID=416 RepID=A0A140E593_9GAMM|nr:MULTISPECIES: pyruvate kinase [Methylomonas]AMK75567.1 pyruvate kinase [Methylomonas denitrificans]OAI09185.1 pyruvate kinase [Methylomonas methanica]TCV79064.1 pyruvate kinase [Methylomonas methanica]